MRIGVDMVDAFVRFRYHFGVEFGGQLPIAKGCPKWNPLSGQHAAGEKLKELESRITANKELMHQISVYRRTKPAHDGLKTAKKPERYREAFHADLTLYEAAVRYFRQQGLKKLPAVSKLQAENEALISEKNGIYTEYREQKARAAELQKVKSNLAAMLRQERTKEVRRDWER